MDVTTFPRTRTEVLGQINAIEQEFKAYTGTDYYKSNRADLLRQHIIVLDRLLSIIED